MSTEHTARQVSTAHTICDAARREAARREAAFETRDFYLARFLRCSGYELVDPRTQGRRKVVSRGSLEEAADALNAEHIVPPLAKPRISA